MDRMHISSPRGNCVCSNSVAPDSHLIETYITVSYLINIYILLDNGFDLNSCYVSHPYSQVWI